MLQCTNAEAYLLCTDCRRGRQFLVDPGFPKKGLDSGGPPNHIVQRGMAVLDDLPYVF
jgi:hypothetical protein